MFSFFASSEWMLKMRFTAADMSFEIVGHVALS